MNRDMQESVNYRSCMQNRELSWLKFNQRVLEEANCPDTPLLERFHFLSIFTSNLDEFFMVRVGSLIDYMLFSPDYSDNKTGMTAAEQLSEIYRACIPLYVLRDDAFSRINRELSGAGITYVRMSELRKPEEKLVEDFFTREVMPVLSPQIIDQSHPFPHIGNKQLNVAVALRQQNHGVFGIIPVPAVVRRVFTVDPSERRFVLVEDVLLHFAEKVFEKYKVAEKAVICVTRNADIDTDAGLLDEDTDYRQHMKKILKKRLRLSPVRLEIQGEMSEDAQKYLRSKLGLERAQVFRSHAPLDLSYCFGLDARLPFDMKRALLQTPFTPQPSPMVNPSAPIIQQVLRRDILLSYPYEAMKPLLNLLRESAEDPDVVSIKITLYRIARQSTLAEALIEAAENGKDVTVLMELRARFDEENNIEWAQRLEEAGCRVIYGMDGFKVHSKICLITRNDHGVMRHITQVGTGNYNEKTARQYTDVSLVTASETIGADAAEFFKNMGLGNLQGSYQRLLVAPNCFKNQILSMMDEQIQLGKEGYMLLKFNSLTDIDIIRKLSEASCAGVKVEMIVRGICCLLPGVPGKTEHISVTSIVGRYLEHSRIFCFGRGEQEKMYIASADFMTRNTVRRVEIACPVDSPEIRSRLHGILDAMLQDNVKARALRPDGSYCRKAVSGERICAQELLMKQAAEQAGKAAAAPEPERRSIWQRMRRLFQ